MYPPDNNVLYDVCEQMNDQMAFLDQCFTRTKGELLRNASWNAVLAHSCRETVEETLKGALMLYGSSQYYVGQCTTFGVPQFSNLTPLIRRRRRLR